MSFLAYNLFSQAIDQDIEFNKTNKIRNRRNLRNSLTENINYYSDIDFKFYFRLSKDQFIYLCNELRQKTRLRSSQRMSLECKVLTALAFYGTGSYQKIVGRASHVSQPMVSKCLKEVTTALVSMAVYWIVFPKTIEERRAVKQGFYDKFKLPGTIGAIDCTHIAIIRPNDDIEHEYFNRKHFHSINVQMICDSNLKILNVNAKFSGANHDAHVWRLSTINNFMQNLHRNVETAWLLGDSAYPLRPWLLTPILDAPEGSKESNFTKTHVMARNTIERCFGVLKNRFRCLLKHRVLHYDPETASNIVIACCVLHNMFINDNIVDFDEHPQNSQSINMKIFKKILNTYLCKKLHPFYIFKRFFGVQIYVSTAVMYD